MNDISLYFHIPFCVKKCAYCAFFSLPNAGEGLKDAYCTALEKQISFFDTDKKVQSVYFGGGTPPMLGIDRLCKLIFAVREKYGLASDCEITVEVNPGTVGKRELTSLLSAGCNRLSVGIQSADDAILRFLGRIHNKETAFSCVEDAFSAGFYNVSADLIFALPGRTPEGLSDELDSIMSTGVTHISAYSLQLEEGTPLFEKRLSLVFPDEEKEENEYLLLCGKMKENGFSHYEISSYAKPGFESRHNLGYWTGREYFGFGAGASSFLCGKRFSSPPDINAFIDNASSGAFAPTDYDSAKPLSESELEEERIMLGLRTDIGVRLEGERLQRAVRIASLGYGSVEKGILRLNERGFRVSNEIIAEILL